MAKKSNTSQHKFKNPDVGIVPIEYIETMQDSFGKYSAYLISDRSLPDIRDGLLPVQRRILYSMYKSGYFNSKNTVKSARIVGNVMGVFHPHGDCLHKDTKVTLLNGTVLTIEELYKLGKDVDVLAIDSNGKIVPAKAHSFRIGQYTDTIYNIKLTNGSEIKVTGNHPFRMLDGSWVKAENLKPLTFIDYGKVTTKDGYRLIKGYNTNLTTIHNLVYGVKDDLSSLNSQKDVIQKEIIDKFDLPTKQFINLVQKLNKIPSLTEFVEMTNTKYILNFCENDTDLIDSMSKEVPLIQEIVVEKVNQEPMYDFTVDNHENMLISASSDNTLVASVHNSAIYGALARMTKDWIMGEPLIEMSGNNGSIDGDMEAAPRYTESRLTKFSEDILLSNLKLKNIVPYDLNYDDTEYEPNYLPSKLPNILINGSEGIGTGFASNSPTFNISEVIQACIAELKNPKITDDEIIDLIPNIDLPTGGLISNYKEYKEILKSGQGTIKVRGNYRIEEDTKNKQTHIIFTDIPYRSLKPKIVNTIKEAIMNKEVKGIIDVFDNSGLNPKGEDIGVYLDIVCSDNANINAILGYLFTKTQLRKTVPVNMTMVINGKPKLAGVPKVIREFNKIRIHTFTKGLKIQMKDLEVKKEITEGYIKLIENIDEVIAIIKESESKGEALKTLMEKLSFTELQATKILDMNLHRINKTDKESNIKNLEEITKQLEVRNVILSSETNIKKAIIKSYKELEKQYGKPRKTVLKEEDEIWEFNAEEIIPKENMAVGITKDGFFKVSNFRSFKSSTTDNSELEYIIETDSLQKLIVVFSNGLYAYLPIHKLPLSKWSDSGKHFSTLGLDVGGSDVAFVTTYDGIDKQKELILLKNNGVVKKSLAFDYVKTRAFFKELSGIGCKEDEKVIAGWLIDKNEENYLALVETNYASMFFDVNEVPTTSIKSAGSSGMTIPKNKGRYITEYQLFHDVSEIPEFCVQRERGKAGWNRPKKDGAISLYAELEKLKNKQLLENANVESSDLENSEESTAKEDANE